MRARALGDYGELAGWAAQDLEHASEGVDMITRRTIELIRKSGGTRW